MKPIFLTEKSHTILTAIAKGRSYEQILGGNPSWTYSDIFQAAAEALEVAESPHVGKSYDERMGKIRQTYPRAYEKWSDEEDNQLRQLLHLQMSVKKIALILQRQPSAIRSRGTKLNLTPCPSLASGRGE